MHHAVTLYICSSCPVYRRGTVKNRMCCLCQWLRRCRSLSRDSSECHVLQLRRCCRKSDLPRLRERVLHPPAGAGGRLGSSAPTPLTTQRLECMKRQASLTKSSESRMMRSRRIITGEILFIAQVPRTTVLLMESPGGDVSAGSSAGCECPDR